VAPAPSGDKFRSAVDYFVMIFSLTRARVMGSYVK
jgi:hypothetical protein